VVTLLGKTWWIATGARLEGPKLEPEGPRAEVGFPTADLGFSSIQRTLACRRFSLDLEVELQQYDTIRYDTIRYDTIRYEMLF